MNVFVYGTLKEGFGNHRLLQGCRLVSRFAELHGPFRMVSLQAFPGIIRDKKTHGIIYGEVYEVDEEVLHSLDILEGHPNFYTRTEYIINYADQDGIQDVASVYILPYQKYKGHTPVENNKWKESDEEYQARFEKEVGRQKKTPKKPQTGEGNSTTTLEFDELRAAAERIRRVRGLDRAWLDFDDLRAQRAVVRDDVGEDAPDF